MFNKTLYFMLALCMSTAASAQGIARFQAACQRDLSPMRVEFSQPKLTFEVFNNRSVADLDRLHGGSGGHAVGLTQLHYRAGYRIKGRTLEDASSAQECFSGALLFELVAESLRVDIASEFAPGTCAYADILAHEMRHVAAYQQHFAAISPTIRSALQNRFNRVSPFFGAIGETGTALKSELGDGWVPYMRAAVDAGAALQDAIDTPEEEVRSARTCNGEIGAFLRRARR